MTNVKKGKYNFKRLFSGFLAIILIVEIFSSINISAFAEEITPQFSYSYLSNGVWKNFNGRIEGSTNIDGLRIQNKSTGSYYLQYRTQNSGVGGFYSYVKSNDTSTSAYAGSSGKAMQKLQIQPYSSSGTKLVNEIVVMWRVKTSKSKIDLFSTVCGASKAEGKSLLESILGGFGNGKTTLFQGVAK